MEESMIRLMIGLLDELEKSYHAAHLWSCTARPSASSNRYRRAHLSQLLSSISTTEAQSEYQLQQCTDINKITALHHLKRLAQQLDRLQKQQILEFARDLHKAQDQTFFEPLVFKLCLIVIVLMIAQRGRGKINIRAQSLTGGMCIMMAVNGLIIYRRYHRMMRLRQVRHWLIGTQQTLNKVDSSPLAQASPLSKQLSPTHSSYQSGRELSTPDNMLTISHASFRQATQLSGLRFMVPGPAPSTGSQHPATRGLAAERCYLKQLDSTQVLESMQNREVRSNRL